MNPLGWSREHKAAWGVITLLGAILGMLLGWLWSPFSHAPGIAVGALFMVWLQAPEAYWPWLAFGALISGLTFYFVRLLRDSN